MRRFCLRCLIPIKVSNSNCPRLGLSFISLLLFFVAKIRWFIKRRLNWPILRLILMPSETVKLSKEVWTPLLSKMAKNRPILRLTQIWLNATSSSGFVSIKEIFYFSNPAKKPAFRSVFIRRKGENWTSAKILPVPSNKIFKLKSMYQL